MHCLILSQAAALLALSNSCSSSIDRSPNPPPTRMSWAHWPTNSPMTMGSWHKRPSRLPSPPRMRRCETGGSAGACCEAAQGLLGRENRGQGHLNLPLELGAGSFHTSPETWHRNKEQSCVSFFLLLSGRIGKEELDDWCFPAGITDAGLSSLLTLSRTHSSADWLPHQAPGAGAGSWLCCPGHQGWSPAVQPQRCLHQEGADRECTQGF